jgi:hypothetical protein
MTIENLKPESLGLCPCGRQIYADVRQGAVMHEEPACKKFLELEPDKFLTYVRRSRGLAIEN